MRRGRGVAAALASSRRRGRGDTQHPETHTDSAKERTLAADDRRWYLLALVLLSVLLWLPRLHGPLDLRYDAGVYYILGTSLAEGQGYRLLNEPGAIQAIQYPPLLPLLVASTQWLAGTSDPAVVGHWLRLAFAAIVIGYIVAVFLLASLYLPRRFAFLVALITLLHVQTTWLSDLLFSEIPFALVTILFFLSIRLNGREATWLAGLFGAAAFLLRSIGVALLAAWVGESLLRRRWRQTALRALIAAAPVLAWQGYVAQVKQSAEYQQPAYAYQRAPYQFYNVSYFENLRYIDTFAPELGRISAGAMAWRVAGNLAHMPLSWGEAVSVEEGWVRWGLRSINARVDPVQVPLGLGKVPLLFLGVGVLAGLILLARRGIWLIPLYVAGSVALIALTPWPGQFQRYLAPLVPLLALSLVITLLAARDWTRTLKHRWGRHAGAAVVAATAAGILVLQVAALYKVYTMYQQVASYRDAGGREAAYRLFFYDQNWQRHDAALEWLGSVADPNAVVATSTPHSLFLKTGLRAVMPPFEGNTAEAQRLLEAVPVRYLVVDGLEFADISRRYAARAVRVFPERWELVYSTPDSVSRIYRRVPEGSTGSP